MNKKLNEEQISEIRKMYSAGVSRHIIAEKFNIHFMYPSKLCRDIKFPNKRAFRFPLRKLNEEQVIQVIIKLLKGVTHKEIASGIGVHQSCISKIATGRRWKHLFQKYKENYNLETLELSLLNGL
jgi:DNA invertase Pin-like site-specific DNA recombinase